MEVCSCVQNILSYPLALSVLEDKVRRCLISRFPYGVRYNVEPDRLYILESLRYVAEALREHELPLVMQA